VPTAPIDLVQSVLSRHRRTFDTHPVEVAVDADLPVVDVDPLLMDHVLTNLLENAVRHGRADRPIEVRGAATGSVVQLSVVDHGPGVPHSDRERVFEEFVRRSAPTDGGGTGLGLTIVRALVEEHGGTVWCEETAAGGATFVVQLPTRQAERGCS
jgi:two-component system sensor histidine kinase KdpD